MLPDAKSEEFQNAFNITWGVVSALGWSLLIAIGIAIALLLILGAVAYVVGMIRGS